MKFVNKICGARVYNLSLRKQKKSQPKLQSNENIRFSLSVDQHFTSETRQKLKIIITTMEKSQYTPNYCYIYLSVFLFMFSQFS